MGLVRPRARPEGDHWVAKGEINPVDEIDLGGEGRASPSEIDTMVKAQGHGSCGGSTK